MTRADSSEVRESVRRSRESGLGETYGKFLKRKSPSVKFDDASPSDEEPESEITLSCRVGAVRVRRQRDHNNWDHIWGLACLYYSTLTWYRSFRSSKYRVSSSPSSSGTKQAFSSSSRSQSIEGSSSPDSPAKRRLKNGCILI